MFWQKIVHRVERAFRGRDIGVWYSPMYRFPFTTMDARIGMELRRADYVVWYLLESRAIRLEEVRTALKIRYEDLARVHSVGWLEKLSQAETLGRIFALEAWDIQVDEIMTTIRVACGGTLGAARESLKRRCATLNLLGGFHHAGPDWGSGFCPVNDIAVAIAALRAEGMEGWIAILDLDAHPPDGTAACVQADRKVWLGSISGSDWGPLPGVDETILPVGSGDDVYLQALDGLLKRMPKADLTFVIAGGDVLGGDHLGALGMSLAGARERERRVAASLRERPSVWVPGGGYSAKAWQVLAGVGLILSTGSSKPIPASYDPLRARFSAIARQISRAELEGDTDEGFTEADLAEALGLPQARAHRLLGLYSAEGLEVGFFRYGLLEHLRRLGYSPCRVDIGAAEIGDRMRVWGESEGKEHLLVELVVEKQWLEEEEVLYIHWLMLQHPRGNFSPSKPRLPGQQRPGLGFAREAGEMLLQMARRLGLAGVALRPAWYHIAYAMRHDFRFADPERQRRFEALQAVLAATPLLEATQAIAEGRVERDGKPYVWEADIMVYWLQPRTISVPTPQSVEGESKAFRILASPTFVESTSKDSDPSKRPMSPRDPSLTSPPGGRGPGGVAPA